MRGPPRSERPVVRTRECEARMRNVTRSGALSHRARLIAAPLALAVVALLPAAAAARNSFTLDTSPDSFAAVAVDSAGSGYFSWEHKLSPTDDTTMFCKVARGGSCTVPMTLPTPPLNPAPYDSTDG